MHQAFCGNNQELGRATVDMDMDERTLREIYLPPFEAAIKEAGVWTVMGAYTKFRGEHCAYSDYLINKILKGEFGFQGLVMSDWGGTYSTTRSRPRRAGPGDGHADYRHGKRTAL